MIGPVDVHLLDGTYELFRHHFAVPSRVDADGIEIAAARGVVNTVFMMLEEGATHLAVATDHTVESFRNDLYDGYKTGDGIDPDLFGQFPIIEDALDAFGVRVLPMDEYEADDGLASGARVARSDRRVGRVFLCTPDKDLAQCVEGDRVVQLDRRRGELRDADGVREKFGVDPGSIPDWLALTGDSADGRTSRHVVRDRRAVRSRQGENLTGRVGDGVLELDVADRKSTRLNSSH